MKCDIFLIYNHKYIYRKKPCVHLIKIYIFRHNESWSFVYIVLLSNYWNKIKLKTISMMIKLLF